LSRAHDVERLLAELLLSAMVAETQGEMLGVVLANSSPDFRSCLGSYHSIPTLSLLFADTPSTQAHPDSVPAFCLLSAHTSRPLPLFFTLRAIINVAMQFNAEPAVQDPRFAPNTTTNHSHSQPPDNNPSAMSATREHVDIDKQCGVPQFNGVPCPAALACPAHSIRDKYAVPGRTAPLEQLMARQQQEFAQLPQQ
jgi:hypothetical protein